MSDDREQIAALAKAMQESPAWPVVFKADSAALLAAVALGTVREAQDRRVTELLASNNALLQRARDAEQALRNIAGVTGTYVHVAISSQQIARQAIEAAGEPLRHSYWMADVLNQRTDVEHVLRDVFRNNREPLSREECRDLANQLSIPPELRHE